MNSLLKVNLKFRNEENKQKPGAINLRSKNETTIFNIDKLIGNLYTIIGYYQGTDQLIAGMLIDVNYNDIIAKSNRIEELLKPNRKKVNDFVVGARFSNDEEGKEKHIITYYVDLETVKNTIYKLQVAKKFVQTKLGGRATSKNFNVKKDKKDNINYEGFEYKKSKLRQLVVDCSVVEAFSVPGNISETNNEEFLVTFYKTEQSVSNILEKIKVDEMQYRYSFFGEDTILVNKDLYDYLNQRIPYLISMISSDLSKISYEDIEKKDKGESIKIPEPTIEPTIGVIDTLFDESVYFSKWVENHDYLDEFEKWSVKDEHRIHGTEISSIIVDGPRLNPWLDDGCGRFKVKHFGVCLDKISTSRLVRKIKEIVNQNPDIHVWNLSLGTDDEVSKNFVSFDAAVLDELQAKKNVIFVVAGTNDNRKEKRGKLRVGSPADSLNSIVVNSVRRDGNPSSFSRKGEVLSFFNKPDVSYYGGDYNEKINTYSPYGETEECGTSLAAPWISRKLAFLIDVIGLPREIAKALIIDSAAGWDYKKSTYKNHNIIGYGVVPIDISKVLSSENSEIRFYLYGTSKSYKTSNYAIPVPKDKDGKYPYIARAILCYFPKCSRTQGVDYTNRELSLKFGRIKTDGSLDDINENVQDEDGSYVDERRSRKEFRKWENTKFISKVLKNNKALKAYDERMWGFSVTSKERLDGKNKEEMNFGAVITLKEINNINRIKDFITLCEMRGWIVNEIDIKNKIDAYVNNQEEIHFIE